MFISVSCTAGHTVYCCGKYSRWVAIRTHQCLLRSSSTYCETVIVWSAQSTLLTKCTHTETIAHVLCDLHLHSVHYIANSLKILNMYRNVA